MALSFPNGRPQVHGHRGCRGLRPENTLPAFRHALAIGVDALELDVVVSQDLQVAVAHDPWLPAHLGLGPTGERIDPVKEREYNIYQMPYAVIRQCAVGLWPDPHFPEQLPISTYRPLLREVLVDSEQLCQRLRRPQVTYSVEIKCDPVSDTLYHPIPNVLVRLVVAELLNAGVADRCTILSFDSRVLQAVRQLYPALATCLLIEDQPIIPATLFEQLGFVPEVIGPDYRLLSAELMHQLRQQWPKLHIVPWTLNSLEDLAHSLAWAPAGITTDYPDRLVTLLK